MPEPKYIERGSLLQKAKLLQGKLFAVPLILDAIEYAPTVDVVEVVRCVECKYVDTVTCPITGAKTFCCDYGIRPFMVEPTHFCSYGVRKEG